MGVEVDRTNIRLVVQLPAGAPANDEDLDDIVDTLADLIGPDASVTERADVRPEPELRPDAGVRWFYTARVAQIVGPMISANRDTWRLRVGRTAEIP